MEVRNRNLTLLHDSDDYGRIMSAESCLETGPSLQTTLKSAAKEKTVIASAFANVTLALLCIITSFVPFVWVSEMQITPSCSVTGT